jgi:hypothetical protein
MKKDKKTNNNLQNTTKKIKARAIRTPQTTGDELPCFGTVRSSCSNSGARHVTFATNQVKIHE